MAAVAGGFQNSEVGGNCDAAREHTKVEQHLQRVVLYS